ncbi:ferredoxin [Candidatus Woesearchaeota archaeon]|nr:ferredoxin [Candidatus Woesearchaeota archaeon]
MAKYKIVHDIEECIGCGACAAVCDNWVMEGDKAKEIETEFDEIGCNQDAVDSCPVDCIKIVEEK